MSEEIKIINGYKIYENLEHIRIRPLIALTSKSITALENYLWGYWVYANKNYSGEQIYNDGDPDFNEFKWWLSGQPNIPLSTGPRFHELLLEKCNNDEEKAFDLFFEKLNEFKQLNTKRKIEFDINHWIKVFNETVPKRYFKRNIPEYHIVTYVNHSIFLFQGKDFDGVFVFLKRCLDYLEVPENKKRLNSKYLEKVDLYLQSMFSYLENNELVNKEKIEKYDILKRIKTKS